MNRTILIHKFFDRARLLTMRNPTYRKSVLSLFRWLTSTDQITKDKTMRCFPSPKIKAVILAKQSLIAAGLEEVAFLLHLYPTLSFVKRISDGQKGESGTVLAELTGDAKTILGLERTIINMLQRMSGITTVSQNLLRRVARAGGPPKRGPLVGVFGGKRGTGPVASTETEEYYVLPTIAATRKTPWGLLDKKAVAVGGGLTHRLSLKDGILIKDNHLMLIQKEFGLDKEEAVKKALELVFSKTNGDMVEIEVTTPAAARAALDSFSRIKPTAYLTVMVDNWQAEDVKKTIAEVHKKYDLSHVLFEASGGITEENIHQWIDTGVDVISLGSLTHSTRAVNMSLEILK